MTTGELVLQLGVGGIFALLVIKMVFDFIQWRAGSEYVNGPKKRPITGPKMVPVDPIIDRLDRINDRLGEIMDVAKSARKRAELNGENSERQLRLLNELETAIRRQIGPAEPTRS